MKATLLLLAPIALLVSCTKNQGENTDPVAPAANIGNEYGVPAPGNPAGYPPANAGYQPVGPINPPAAPPAPANPYGVAPAPPVAAPTPAPTPAPSADLNGNVYTIQSGDSLWGLSRKFKTTVEEIKTLNGLSNNTIIEGRTLIIPGR